MSELGPSHILYDFADQKSLAMHDIVDTRLNLSESVIWGVIVSGGLIDLRLSAPSQLTDTWLAEAENLGLGQLTKTYFCKFFGKFNLYVFHDFGDLYTSKH